MKYGVIYQGHTKMVNHPKILTNGAQHRIFHIYHPHNSLKIVLKKIFTILVRPWQMISKILASFALSISITKNFNKKTMNKKYQNFETAHFNKLVFFVRKMYEDCMRPVSKPYENCMGTVWGLYEDCMRDVWGLYT